MTGKMKVSRKTRKRQAEALAYARRIPSGTGIAHRIAQIVVNKTFEAELMGKIAKMRKEIVQ